LVIVHKGKQSALPNFLPHKTEAGLAMKQKRVVDFCRKSTE
jgi:hypothetical protein